MDRDAAHWEAVEEAAELMHEERFHEALARARDAVLKADPTNSYAFFFLGQALYEVGELEPARDAYRACLNARAEAPRRAHRGHARRAEARTTFARPSRRG